jgi:hypothetical protein
MARRGRVVAPRSTRRSAGATTDCAIDHGQLSKSGLVVVSQ